MKEFTQVKNLMLVSTVTRNSDNQILLKFMKELIQVTFSEMKANNHSLKIIKNGRVTAKH